MSCELTHIVSMKEGRSMSSHGCSCMTCCRLICGMRPLCFQLLIHSLRSIFGTSSRARSHVTTLRKPENTHSLSADIRWMDRIAMAIYERHGYCSCVDEESQYSEGFRVIIKEPLMKLVSSSLRVMLL